MNPENMRNSDQVFEVAFLFVARHFSAQRAQDVKPVLHKLIEMFGQDIHFTSGNANQINFRVDGLTPFLAFQKLKVSDNPMVGGAAFEFYLPTSGSNEGGIILQHKPIKGGGYSGGGTIFEHKPVTRS